MKKSTIYCSLLLLIIAAASCGKDSAGGSTSNKVRSYTEDITRIGGRSVRTYNVKYDDQGRITSVESTTKPVLRTVYQYSTENSFTCDKWDDTTHLYHSIYFVNSLSLIDSTWGHDFKEYGYKSDTSSSKFVYDEDKKLLREKQYLNSYLLPPVSYRSIIYQYDLKGTLVKESASGYYETSYAYDKDVKNTVQLQPFYFPVKEHLPSQTYTVKWGQTISTKHTYVLDDNKRVVSERAEDSDGTITVTTYSYE